MTRCFFSRARPRDTTQEEIVYLTELLDCAHKKLALEKQIANVRKRTPELLQRVGGVMQDANYPLTAEVQQAFVASLQKIQAALARLETVKIE